MATTARRTAYSILFALLLQPLAVHGAPLTWEQCVAESWERNPELIALRHSLAGAGFDTRAAYSGYLPRVSGVADITYGNLGNGRSRASTVAPNGASARTDEQGYFANGGLSVSQNLFSGFGTRATVRQAGAVAAESAALLDLAGARLSFELKSAFAALRYAQRNVKLTEKIFMRRKENLSVVELRYQGGNENRGSYLLSQALFQQAELDRAQARREVDVGRSRLARVLGRVSSEDVDVSGEVPVCTPRRLPDLAPLLAEHPEQRQARERRRAAEAAVGLARSRFYPTLDLVGEAARRTGDIAVEGNDFYTGASLVFPLFTGGENYYRLKSAEAAAAAARAQEQDTERRLRARATETHAAFLTAVERVRSDQQLLAAALVRAEIGRAKYNNGLLSFENWDIIENDLISRQKTVLQSERERVLAEAEWDQSLGKSVFQ